MKSDEKLVKDGFLNPRKVPKYEDYNKLDAASLNQMVKYTREMEL